MTNIFVPFVSAFFASMGFALLYNVRKRHLVIASLCGAFAWMFYLITDMFTNSLVIPYFVSGISIALYSELAATIFKSPATVFLIPGIIPLVPGLTIYRTMEACLYGDIQGFAEGLVNTLKIGGAISLGLILISSFFKILRTRIYKK
ncbi:MAG: threonine/serine exporter family protein [Clostridia bacterium]|nr:threonine/serine exporter family protein [Clostridia bacterium]